MQISFETNSTFKFNVCFTIACAVPASVISVCYGGVRFMHPVRRLTNTFYYVRSHSTSRGFFIGGS